MENVHTVSDEALMGDLRQGQLHCAGLLFERYHVKLFNFFLHLCGDRMLSEDLTQTVFERVIRYRRSYRSEMSFRSWLYQIARNARVDHARRNRLQVSDFSAAADTADEALPVQEHLEAHEDHRRLHRALAHLNDEQRELLVLTRFQELKYREVADLLNITEGAVKVRVHRAIHDLRTIYLKMQDR